jgi:hypothetical protein
MLFALTMGCDKDTLEIIKTEPDTVWVHSVVEARDTIYCTDTVKIIQHDSGQKGYYVLTDSLLEFSSIRYNKYFIVQKGYASTKYEGIPYYILVHVVDENANKLKTWGVYSSECKYNESKWKYTNEARAWVKKQK